MKFKLTAVAGIGLLAGACSLRPPEASGVYSSLPPETTAPHAARKVGSVPTSSAASGFGPVTLDATPRMPGDLVAPVAEARGTRLDPVATLNASAQARSRWEALNPGNLNRPPLLQSRLALAIGLITAGDIKTGAVPQGTHGKVVKPTPVAAEDLYDRDAMMLRLIQGGKAASKKICDGC